MRWLISLLLWALPVSALPGSARADQVALEAQPVTAQARHPEIRQVGSLTWLAGFELRSTDKRFGGISGFERAQDTLVAVSDRGYWIVLHLQLSGGRLTGVSHAQIHPLRGVDGRQVTGAFVDAEEVTFLADGRVLVSYEHEHRLGVFPSLSALAAAPEQPFAAPAGVARSAPNGGVEALVTLTDGRVLALREKPHDTTGHHQGWLLNVQGAPEELLYAVDDGFQPTGLTRLPDGTLVAIERRFSLMSGAAGRLVRFDAGAVAKGALIRTRELGRFGGDVICDNYEAVAAMDPVEGRQSVLIGSDDNYNAVQRTLLIQLQLPQSE